MRRGGPGLRRRRIEETDPRPSQLSRILPGGAAGFGVGGHRSALRLEAEIFLPKRKANEAQGKLKSLMLRCLILDHPGRSSVFIRS